MEKDKKKFTDNSKKMTEIRRVLCDNSNNRLAERLGLSPSVVSSICSGRKGIGRQMAEKILKAFPEVSRSWLYADDGPMLISSGNVGDNNSGNVATTGGTVTTIDKDVMQMLKDNQRERLELLAIIRNLTQKP